MRVEGRPPTGGPSFGVSQALLSRPRRAQVRLRSLHTLPFAPLRRCVFFAPRPVTRQLCANVCATAIAAGFDVMPVVCCFLCKDSAHTSTGAVDMPP